MDQQLAPRKPMKRPGSLSALVILAAFAFLMYAAAFFSQAMGHQVIDVARKVAMTDQLNAAGFLARELAAKVPGHPESSMVAPPGPMTDPAYFYRQTFENFITRHGVRAMVIDAETHDTLLQGYQTLSMDARFHALPVLGELNDDPLSQALESRRKVQGLVEDHSGRYLASLVPIAGTPDMVVVFRPESEIVATGQRLAGRFTGFLLAGLALIMVLFVLFMRTITRPLEVLTRAAERIGAGQLGQTVDVESATEVRTLAEAFNHMSRELQLKYAELAETGARLEDSNDRYRKVLRDYERQNAELEVFNAIVFEASNRSEARHDLGALVTMIQKGFDLRLVALFLHDEHSGWNLECTSDALLATCDFEAGGLIRELEEVAQHGKVRLIRAKVVGPSRPPQYGKQIEWATAALLPVVVQGKLEGAFVLIADKRTAFGRHTVDRYRHLTHQLGIILHKDALLAQTIKRREQLEQLNQLGSALLSEREFDLLIPRVLHEVGSMMQAEQSMLALLNAQKVLTPILAIDSSDTAPAYFSALEECWNQRVLNEGTSVLIREYPRLNLWTPDGMPLGDTSAVSRFQSYLGLPIKQGGETIGVLALFAERASHFDQDDVQFLATIANQLAAAIVNSRLFQEISRRDERRNIQLATAKKFQADRLPTSYDDGYVEAKVSLFPADELAGDFFDAFRLSPNVTGLVIGDVATKGIAASLLAFSMLSIFRNLATSMRPPAKVMEMANETTRAQLKEDFWFVTAFYARINHSDMTMTYCKAGHVLPILYRAATGTCEYLDGDGLPLGILDDAEYAGAQVDVAPGDRLVLYTDGVTELRDGEGKQFGIERLARVIQEYGHRTVESMREGIIAAVEAYADPQGGRDDILVAVAGINPDPWLSHEVHYDDMEEIVEKIMEDLRCFPLDTPCLYSIRLALNETIANSHFHGNQGDGSLPIHLDYRITDTYFALRVRDNGEGFDCEKLPDPTVPENLILTHGRGIFLMRQLMDELEFNDSGNQIRMRKDFTFKVATEAAEALKASQRVEFYEEAAE